MKMHIAGFAMVCSLALGAEAANLEAGRAGSIGCQACHGSHGVGTAADIPNLAGQKSAYLQAQLRAFRKGERQHSLMNAIAAQLSDDDVANLAAFWSSLPLDGGADAHAAADPAGRLRRSRMTFPTEFPRGFVMYKEEVDAANHTAQRSWANCATVGAARAGKALPWGSVIMVENLAVKAGVPGEVTSYSAMESRKGWGDGVPEILRNGDWSYALFDAKKTLRADINYARCLACHKPQAPDSYVFGFKGDIPGFRPGENQECPL